MNGPCWAWCPRRGNPPPGKGGCAFVKERPPNAGCPTPRSSSRTPPTPPLEKSRKPRCANALRITSFRWQRPPDGRGFYHCRDQRNTVCVLPERVAALVLNHATTPSARTTAIAARALGAAIGDLLAAGGAARHHHG